MMASFIDYIWNMVTSLAIVVAMRKLGGSSAQVQEVLWANEFFANSCATCIGWHPYYNVL
jgi:hypothetical protein